MFLRSSTKRTTLAGILATASVLGTSQPVHAGPLCEWLFGRHTQPAVAVPYAAGYPYAAAYPYAASYPYAAAYPAVATPAAPAPVYASQTGATYAAGYAAMPTPAAPATTVPVIGSGVQGAAALQMPAYQANYPAAVPGAIPAQGPGDYGYSMYSPPPAAQIPVTGVPQTSYYGTGNVYPSYGSVPTSQVAPAAAVTPVTAYQVPVVTNPSTIQTYPGIPASRPGVMGGLSRFFGSMFGTSYESSYYRAPVTYYRPVTTVDPNTGATTVVQQPCSSYQYQLQRSPVTTFAPAAPAAVAPAAPAAACPPASNMNPYGAVPGTQYGGSTTGNVPATYYGPPATSPSTTAPQYAPGAGADQIDVGQPQLPTAGQVAPTTGTSARPPLTPPPTTWWQQSGHRESSASRGPSTALQSPDLQADADAPRSTARPLPAVDYPYHRPATADSTGGSAEPAPPARPSRPSAPASEDRVAQATWGYKTIAWDERGQTPASESSSVQRAAFVDQPETPSRNTDAASETNATRPSAALRAPANAPVAPRMPVAQGTPAVIAPERAFSPAVPAPSAPPATDPYADYDGSGWRASGR